MFKVVRKVTIQVKEKMSDGEMKGKYLLVQQTGSKMKPLPVFHNQYEILGENLSFQKAKEIRTENKNSEIVRM